MALFNRIIFSVLIGTFLFACEASEMDKSKSIWMHGTVKYISLEGGFYGIITDNGQKLLPMNLLAKYRQDGAIIKFQGKINPDVMTIQQWGKPFTILEIQLIKAGKSHRSKSF